jgi:CelD/BcsL family acetyltransferase involved in cellulose biosynthesis
MASPARARLRDDPTGAARPVRQAPSSAPTTIDWIRSPDDIDALADEWLELETSIDDRTVLSAFDYNAAWYHHYGREGVTTLLGIARRGSSLVGVAPLVIRVRRIGKVPLTCIEFAAHEAYAGEFLVEDDRPDTLVMFLESLAATTRFDLICLNGLEMDSDRFRPLREAAARLRLQIELTDHPNAMVDLSRGYEQYFRSRSPHFRHAVRRYTRRIEDRGERRVEGVLLRRGVDSLDAAVDRMIRINEASYKLNGERLADCHRRFLSELARRFGPRGMLAMPILSIGGRDAAYVFGLVERGCFYDVTLAYDEAFAHLRPGTHLIQELLKDLAGAGVYTVISHGAHDYKKHWATAFLPSTRVFMFSSSLKASVTRLIRFRLRSLWARFGAGDP